MKDQPTHLSTGGENMKLWVSTALNSRSCFSNTPTRRFQPTTCIIHSSALSFLPSFLFLRGTSLSTAFRLPRSASSFSEASSIFISLLLLSRPEDKPVPLSPALSPEQTLRFSLSPCTLLAVQSWSWAKLPHTEGWQVKGEEAETLLSSSSLSPAQKHKQCIEIY